MSNEGPRAKRMTICAWSGDLDKAYPIFVIATNAALAGMDVTIYFTFWGLNIIKKNKPWITGRTIMEKMLSLMNRGGSKHLKLSKLHMGGLGRWMLRRMMASKKVPSLEELVEYAKEMGVRLVPCQLAMDVMGLTPDDLIEGLDYVADPGSYIELVSQSDVNFIF